MTFSSSSPETLAAALAARLIHDMSGPASGIVTGLDLQATAKDPDLAASGLALASDSARALLDLLDVCRAAFTASGGDQSAETLERLATACFAGRRATLRWSADAARFGPAAGRAVILLSQIAAAGLGAGGVAELATLCLADHWRIGVAGRGPRAALPVEVIEGLAGRESGGGVAGRWAPARLLNAVTATAGGRLSVETLTDGFAITVTLPTPGG